MKPVILYSGGLDSRVLLELAVQAQAEPFCIVFAYGQQHIREIEVAQRTCTKIGVPIKVVNLDLKGIQSKLTDGSQPYSNVSEWYVPSRNLIFTAIAASYAESLGRDRIWIGANYEDRVNLFPDCYQEWIVQANVLFRINGSYPIQVEAPLLGFTKPMVQMLARILKIENEEVLSGYGK